MKANITSRQIVEIEDFIEDNINLHSKEIHQLLLAKNIDYPYFAVVQRKKQIEVKTKKPLSILSEHWTDQTPTNHRLTKTYRQLIKNEFNDGEVVGKRVN
jgi:hypothetical protein